MNSTERYQWRCNDLFIDSFEHVSLFILVFLLLNLGMFLFTRLDEYNTEEILLEYLTFLFEKICGVNSLVHLPNSEVG